MLRDPIDYLSSLFEAVEPHPQTVEELVARWTPHLSDSHCGIWVPEEWCVLVHQTLVALQHVAPDFKIEQIKEKFSTLRLYYSIPHRTPPSVRAVCRLLVQGAENQTLLLLLHSKRHTQPGTRIVSDD